MNSERHLCGSVADGVDDCYQVYNIVEEGEYPTLWACVATLHGAFVMIFAHKVVSQFVLQHHLAAAATCISALLYLRFSYMPTNS